MTGIDITVCMPCYLKDRKDEYLFQQAASSMLQQHADGFSFELLVIDDGSVVKPEISKEHAKVRIIRFEGNRGLVSSCNTGLTEARGRYFVRFDADDYAMPYMLRDLYANFYMFNKPFLATTDYLIHEMDGSFTSVLLSDTGAFSETVDDNLVLSMQACGVMYETEHLKEIGGYRDFFYEEHDLHFRCQKAGWWFSNVRSAGWIYRQRQDSMTADWHRRVEGCKELEREWGSEKVKLLARRLGII